MFFGLDAQYVHLKICKNNFYNFTRTAMHINLESLRNWEQ